MSEYARNVPEIKDTKHKNAGNSLTHIESNVSSSESKQDDKKIQKPASILVTGRSKGFYREYLNFFECELSIEEMKKKILEIDERRDISVGIEFSDVNFNDTSLIDFLFSRRLTGIELQFTELLNQDFLNYVADKIEEHSSTLFEVCSSNPKSDERKGFFNFDSVRRKRICEMIRNKKWEEEVFKKPLFGSLNSVHSYQIHDE